MEAQVSLIDGRMHKRVVELVGGDQSLDLPSKARKPVVEYAGEEYSIVCNNVRTDRLSEWMGQKKMLGFKAKDSSVSLAVSLC